MLRRILGPFIFLLGVSIAAWVGYNLFIERTVYAKGSPAPAIVFAFAFIWVGWKWMHGEQAR